MCGYWRDSGWRLVVLILQHLQAKMQDAIATDLTPNCLASFDTRRPRIRCALHSVHYYYVLYVMYDIRTMVRVVCV